MLARGLDSGVDCWKTNQAEKGRKLPVKNRVRTERHEKNREEAPQTWPHCAQRAPAFRRVPEEREPQKKGVKKKIARSSGTALRTL